MVYLLKYSNGSWEGDYWDDYFQILETDKEGLATLYEEVLERTSHGNWGWSLQQWDENKEVKVKHPCYQHILEPITEKEMKYEIEDFLIKERRILERIESVLTKMS